MENETEAIRSDLAHLSEQAQALMAATAGVVGDEIDTIRKRLALAIERGGEACRRTKDRIQESARVTDAAIRKNPYPVIAIGIGAGALIGFAMASRCKCARS